VRRSLLLRSLVIQGSWNYRGMIGTGMAYALLPALRYLERVDADAAGGSEALARHAAHFNSHPYLSTIALGSLARLEAEGAPGDMVRRFRSAIPGPLGALGDRAVWATWLPLVSLLALCLYALGVPPWAVVATFLLVYNAGHLALRVWGLRLGWDEGARVGARLRGAGFVARSDRLGTGMSLLVGLLIGLLFTDPQGLGGLSLPWLGASVGGFAAGAVAGARMWRPAALLTALIVSLLFVAGFAGWMS
jgi:PTS system mannose-specific IID component